jgi:hypothetical protein
LNTFEKTKESELGIRITRHMKLLRRSADFGHLKSVWSKVVQEPAIPQIENAEVSLGQQTFSFDKNLPVSKPAKIYVLTLATVLCLREKLLGEVDPT